MTEYGVNQIHQLKGLEAVRAKPAMYIGTTSNTNQLAFECIDNSVDEYLSGTCTNITIQVFKDATVIVEDNGRGIPVGISDEIKDDKGNPLNILTAALTNLHTGGKFKGESYELSAGTYGIGVKATNALSDFLEVTVKRDGHIYHQTFTKGVPTSEIETIGDTEETGTIIKYHPDKEIFKASLFPNEVLKNRLNELAFLNSGLRIHYINETNHTDIEFYYKQGISGYVEQMIGNKTRLFDNIFAFKGTTFDDDNNKIFVDISFIYDDETEPITKIKTFANNINTHEGGYHLQGFKNAIKDNFNNYGIEYGIIKEPIELQYWLDGLYAVVSVKLKEAQLDGQTKTKLGSMEAKDAVETVMKQYFDDAFKQKKLKSVFEAIVQRAIKVKEAEIQARKARDVARKTKKVLKMSMPGKLADCANKTGYRELFLVEGNSAAGSSKEGRDSSYQAILALRGKLLNVNKAEIDKILKSDTITNIIGAIGAGVGDTFNIKNVRYDKIILMCFTGDTKVKMLSGTSKTFEELVEMEKANPNQIYWVYSMDANGNLVVGKATHPRITRQTNDIAKVTLDNGYEIRCTKDHLFMLKDGTYVEAQNLSEGTLLMSFDTTVKETTVQTDVPPVMITQQGNHTVAKIEFIHSDEPINMYDLTVEQYHNFMLDIGNMSTIMVHNCDADVDGSHISSLVLTLFYYYMPELIKQGKVYRVMSPLYRIIHKDNTSEYLLDDAALNKFRKENFGESYMVSRLKGLGEMDPEQLAETSLSPATRTLKRIIINEAERAARSFEVLMGKDASARREFIENNSAKVDLSLI